MDTAQERSLRVGMQRLKHQVNPVPGIRAASFIRRFLLKVRTIEARLEKSKTRTLPIFLLIPPTGSHPCCAHGEASQSHSSDAHLKAN
jgi:hypothetical protein